MKEGHKHSFKCKLHVNLNILSILNCWNNWGTWTLTMCIFDLWWGPKTKCIWVQWIFPPPPPLFSAVEQERDLLQPRPYWKEFRFDLTPLPQGETVTAAEFRIYKTLTMGQRANRTLHISVYEIQRENRHRWCQSVFLLSFAFLFLATSPKTSRS